MKKLLTLVFLSICMGMISQPQAKKAPIEYKGVAVINKNILADGKIIVANPYKQHMLMKKAKQWIVKNYFNVNDSIMVVGESISVENQDYSLLLEFTDGEFKYCFTDKLKDEKKLITTGQQIIGNLSKYVLTCKLEDKSW
jgi:hypothetical protein